MMAQLSQKMKRKMQLNVQIDLKLTGNRANSWQVYHRIREAIAGDFVDYGHIASERNLADVCTKPLGNNAHHRLIDPYLFRIPLHLMKAKRLVPNE